MKSKSTKPTFFFSFKDFFLWATCQYGWHDHIQAFPKHLRLVGLKEESINAPTLAASC